VAIAGVWLAAVVFFWHWWLAPSHHATVAGLVANSAVLAFEFVVVPGWFMFFLVRMRRPDPAVEVPELRTAMIVTKAPSEPWQLVRATLEAMLRQDFPYSYDVWLADEKLTDEVIDWCAQHGVHMSTREGVSEYHNARWPRRTKCKEGNLAFFYDNWGYRDYDVVAQLDADHVPAPDYLGNVVAPFADPRVGYVAAPSVCDSNAATSWSARGRLYAEAVLHGSTQAGSNADYAPSCFGSHYAVRTAALKQVGGLGPELAEDFTTTLMLSSYGWRGVFTPDAEAHGEGPDSVADCVTQEFQWARSMMRVLLTITPRYWRGLSFRGKVRLGGAQLWYPLHTVVMLSMVLLPVWALVDHAPLMHVGVGAFFVHLVPLGVVLLVAVWILRAFGFLRPANAPVLSWEAVLFRLISWPWALIGCANALWGAVSGHEHGFRVTPKQAGGERPLPVRVIVPYLVLAAVSIIPVFLVRHPGAARGYYLWALLNGGTYVFASIAVVALHIAENRAHSRPWEILRFAGIRSAVIGAVAAALIVGAVLHGRQGLDGMTWPPGHPGLATQRYVPPMPDVVPANATVDVGASTAPLADNGSRPWTAADLSTVNALERAVRKHLSVVMWFADWQHNRPSLTQLRLIEQRGSIPEITWEPWDATKPPTDPQPKYALRNIVDGKFDAYIRTWAHALAAFGKPVRLRFAQEMNGNWYPWAKENGNTPAEFVRAWRHVHDIFTAAGASNVQWVWSPFSGAPKRFFPGVGYVDRLGITCLNGGTATFGQGWRNFASVCGKSIQQLHALAPQLPIELSEVGSAEAGGSKAAWITGMFAFLAHHPEVKSVVWFDLDKQTDWPIQSSRAAQRAMMEGLQSQRYK
jgi:cellulose synthase (UDP-forming)